MKAWLGLRHNVPERMEAFRGGLKRLGYETVDGLTMDPKQGDVLISWNRMGQNDGIAAEFERRGCPVLVAENGYLGNDFAGDRWYALALSQHNGAGRWPDGGPERWDALGVELEPWRTGGDEIVILPQRGMGPPGVAMPADWLRKAVRETGGRVRAHPGMLPCVPLRDDLRRARGVRTWGSGSGLKALLWGIPVVSDMPGWIGEQDNSDDGRLAMFRRLAWAMWRLSEIASGEAIARVLACA